MSKQHNKLKERGKRRSVLGVILLLVLGAFAGIYINKNHERIDGVLNKDNYGIDALWSKVSDKIPGILAYVKGEHPGVELEEENIVIENPPSTPSPATPTQNTPPVETPVVTTNIIPVPEVVELSIPEPCPSSQLSSGEVEKIRGTILGSEFISDVPKDGAISLTFFTFCNGERIIQNNFLIGKDQILTSGTPDIFLTLHSKYVVELNGNNLCEVIPRANANGDLGAYTDLSTTQLMMKYSGLMKYRDCFGL